MGPTPISEEKMNERATAAKGKKKGSKGGSEGRLGRWKAFEKDLSNQKPLITSGAGKCESASRGGG